MAKKQASKKAAAKEVAAEKSELAAPTHTGMDYGFSILSDDTAAAAREVQNHLKDLASMREKNPRPALYTTADRLNVRKLPIDHPWQHWLLDNMGWSQNGVQQLIGDTGTGKTTKVLSDVGHIMINCNAPVLYLACEGLDKCMEATRMMRCLHFDPEKAHKMLQVIHIEQCMSLVQLMPKLRNWATTWRTKNNLPPQIPLVGIVDPYSRLMTEVEAAGSVEWDKIAKEEAFELGSGNNFGHAKYSAQFSRVLQGFCSLYNVCLFVVHHRTDKVDFNAGRSATYIPEWQKRLNYLSKIGGSGLDGLASTTQVLVSTEKVRDPVLKILTGKKVRIRVMKQSHGADERTGWYELRTVHNDEGGRLDRILRYGAPFCELLNEKGLFGVTLSENGTASCKLLGLRYVDPDVLGAAIASNKGMMDEYYKALSVSGSYSVEDLRDRVIATGGNADS